ncbi:MAG: hypothetical protein ACREJ0_18010, partial [Geminicoccaceae bacterium]
MSGEPFEIFQDVDAIELDEHWAPPMAFGREGSACHLCGVLLGCARRARPPRAGAVSLCRGEGQEMSGVEWILYVLIVACGGVGLAYGIATRGLVLAEPAGSARMQEIAGAVQE